MNILDRGQCRMPVQTRQPGEPLPDIMWTLQIGQVQDLVDYITSLEAK